MGSGRSNCRSWVALICVSTGSRFAWGFMIVSESAWGFFSGTRFEVTFFAVLWVLSLWT